MLLNNVVLNYICGYRDISQHGIEFEVVCQKQIILQKTKFPQILKYVIGK